MSPNFMVLSSRGGECVHGNSRGQLLGLHLRCSPSCTCLSLTIATACSARLPTPMATTHGQDQHLVWLTSCTIPPNEHLRQFHHLRLVLARVVPPPGAVNPWQA